MEDGIVYDFSRHGTLTFEDPGVAKEELGRSEGEIPSCLPQEWGKGFPEGFGDGNSAKIECKCGEHVLYAARIPKEIWPGDWREDVRVFKKTAS